MEVNRPRFTKVQDFEWDIDSNRTHRDSEIMTPNKES